MGIPWDQTKECVQKSFTGKDFSSSDVNNTLIDKDITYWENYGTGLYPSVVINNSTFRGQLETQAVMNAICAGFLKAPHFCKKLLKNKDILDDIGAGVIYFDDGYRIKHLVWIFLVFVIVLCVYMCLYRRKAKREMNAMMKMQIETSVSNYQVL